MATHSSILARRIPWTEETGELQSMGSQRVRHYGVTNTFTFWLNLGQLLKLWGFPNSADKESPYTGDTGNVGSIPGSGKSPGERNGNPL